MTAARRTMNAVHPSISTATAQPPSRHAHTHYPPSRDRVDALADIRRAASLEDVRLDVSVAHTNQRLRARFCVTLRRARRPSWAFGVDIKEAKQFRSQLTHLAKTHTRGKCCCHVVVASAAAASNGPQTDPCRDDADQCPMCVQLRKELKGWPKFPALSTVGKRHLDAKCALLALFFLRVFRVLSRNAQWLQSCTLLRELLRMTEALCKLQYEDEAAALHVIESLTRVTPVVVGAHDTSLRSTHENQDDDFYGGETTDCSICLSSLFEPAEATTADSTECDEHSTSSALTPQPSQGVELPCGHRFHDSCVCLWFHTRLNCPVCRQDPATTAKA